MAQKVMKTTIDRQKAGLIKKYHTLCGKIGMTDEEKREILENNYRVNTSKDLHVDELQHLCKALDESIKQPSKETTRMDKQRKKLFYLIRQICKHAKREYDKKKAYTMACRACGGVRNLNHATESQLIAGIKKIESIEGEEWVNSVFKKILE
jgi:hypothetical protein